MPLTTLRVEVSFANTLSCAHEQLFLKNDEGNQAGEFSVGEDASRGIPPGACGTSIRIACQYCLDPHFG